ncbi:MAG: type II toxin-antitoxin system Phd/YefM family antitoxin [Lysobacteraceae bacterium]
MSESRPNHYGPLDDLPRTPASDVKKLGWRGVMETVQHEGGVVITNHGRPEAVIVPVAEYERLQRGSDAAMEGLRREYDARLAWLNGPTAHDVLNDMFAAPTDLDGKIFTGREF